MGFTRANTWKVGYHTFLKKIVFCSFDFASPGLNVTRFFELAQKYNLAVLLRPGPYICAEFDFGALPWWLLNIDGVQLRTYEEKYVVYPLTTPLPSSVAMGGRCPSYPLKIFEK